MYEMYDMRGIPKMPKAFWERYELEGDDVKNPSIYSDGVLIDFGGVPASWFRKAAFWGIPKKIISKARYEAVLCDVKKEMERHVQVYPWFYSQENGACILAQFEEEWVIGAALKYIHYIHCRYGIACGDISNGLVLSACAGGNYLAVSNPNPNPNEPNLVAIIRLKELSGADAEYGTWLRLEKVYR